MHQQNIHSHADFGTLTGIGRPDFPTFYRQSYFICFSKPLAIVKYLSVVDQTKKIALFRFNCSQTSLFGKFDLVKLKKEIREKTAHLPNGTIFL